MLKSASFTSGKFYIPLIYVFIGAGWILTSDAILNYLQKAGYLPVSDWVGSAKGVIYVLVTGFLLHILISRSDRALIKRERQYKDIYLLNPYPIWFFDPDSYKFVSVNDAAIATYGYNISEFLSMTIFDIYQPADKDLLRQHFAKNTPELYEFHNWHQVKKDGGLIYVDSGSLISTFNNKPAVMVVAMDITERVESVKNLEKIESHLETTLKSISDSFFMLDRQWMIVKANANFYERTGLSEAVIGKSLGSIFPGIESNIIYKAGLRAMDERRSTKVEAYYEGLKKWLHVSCYPSEEGIAVYFTDITERKEIEAEILTQNEQLKKVSWLNSHKIRKPVASLLSLTELLDGGVDQREREQIISRIQKCTWELEETIRQINEEASEVYKSRI
jgi:PAS domain S-box-containing protein